MLYTVTGKTKLEYPGFVFFNSFPDDNEQSEVIRFCETQVIRFCIAHRNTKLDHPVFVLLQRQQNSEARNSGLGILVG